MGTEEGTEVEEGVLEEVPEVEEGVLVDGVAEEAEVSAVVVWWFLTLPRIFIWEVEKEFSLAAFAKLMVERRHVNKMVDIIIH